MLRKQLPRQKNQERNGPPSTPHTGTHQIEFGPAAPDCPPERECAPAIFINAADGRNIQWRFLHKGEKVTIEVFSQDNESMVFASQLSSSLVAGGLEVQQAVMIGASGTGIGFIVHSREDPTPTGDINCECVPR